MKLLVVLSVFIALVKAQDEVTQAKIREVISRLPKFPKPNSNSRVVGGGPTIPHARKYQVALGVSIYGDDYFCSGTLISQRYVLTAAHCVSEADSATVVLGAYNIYIDEASQVIRWVCKDRFHVHEGWNWDTAANDVATISLDKPVQLNEYIQLVQLPSFSEQKKTFALNTATIVGWGLTSDSGTVLTPLLHEGNATVIWNFACSLMFKFVDSYPIIKSNICTSGVGGTNACDGDSGGPLLIGNKQIGIVSWGRSEACEAGWPSVFTRVTSYLLWIQANSDLIIS